MLGRKKKNSTRRNHEAASEIGNSFASERQCLFALAH